MAGVVVITGASSGIGRLCADDLAARGWSVIGASRRGTGGDRWDGVVIDVDDDTSVASGIGRILTARGRIDAVVTAAGWGLAGPVETTPIVDAQAQFETNVWGTMRVVRAVLPAMRATGCGRIVMIGSIAGQIGLPYQAYYAGSKFALEGIAESLAYEVRPHGIHVTVVQPGNFATGFTSARTTADPGPYAAAAEKAITKMVDDERAGADPDAVARTVRRVLAARRPPLRVSVGPADERVGLYAKRVLPFRLFARLARRDLGL